MLGSLILYLKGMRRMMFQLSGFYYRGCRSQSNLPLPRKKAPDCRIEEAQARPLSGAWAPDAWRAPPESNRV